MKCLSVLLLSTVALSAQTATVPIGFTTGQAARLVIGQTTFTSQDSNSSDTVIGAASGLAYAADTLFVADSNRVGATPSNHRVLLYQNLSSMLPGPSAQLNYDRKCPVCLGQATLVLGQPNFTITTENILASPNSLRLATAVASDGIHVVVADTNHNRVLIWNRIPATNDAPADVVVGEPDFATSAALTAPTAKSLLGPQGVWIQNGRLYIADTQNNRVLIYNHIPTSNGAAADVVLGQPNFTTAVEPDLTQQKTSAAANNMLNPVSVTSDGVHLFVTDLGYNRVLIWNSIPSTNAAPADVEIGQPDMISSVANNAYTGTAATSSTDATNKQTPVLCTVSNGKDLYGNPTYPAYCNQTLNFPRFALAGGNRLFIADGGNDRVLVFNQVPTMNATPGDLIIGQIGGTVNQASDAADSLRAPLSLAWDGTNLYVSDAYNRRITVYSMGANTVPYQGVRNSANLDITASDNIALTGTIQAGDKIDITIGYTDPAGIIPTYSADYTYTVVSTDTLAIAVQGLVNSINTSNSGAGDPYVRAAPDTVTGDKVLLTALTPGDSGNNVTVAVTVTAAASATAAGISASAASVNMTGGGDSAKIAAGTIVSLLGSNLSAGTASADLSQNSLPTQLGGTQVYFNGIAAPLYFVSPTQINAQIPWELSVDAGVSGATDSINAYVRSVMSDGSIMTTTPVAVTVVPANPGIYTQPNTEPVMGVLYHASSYAIGILDVEGTATAGDTAIVTINDRTYQYTVVSTDTLQSIRDNLVVLINQDPQVTATPSSVFTRIIVQARVQGPEGNGIAVGTTSTGSGSLTMTSFVPNLCCAAAAGTPVTQQNPAMAGEFVYLFASGLGVPVLSDAVTPFIQTGVKYPLGAPLTAPQVLFNSVAGGNTADVLSASLEPGTVGVYRVLLHLNAGLGTDPYTTLTIAQDIYVSNEVHFPVVASQ